MGRGTSQPFIPLKPYRSYKSHHHRLIWEAGICFSGMARCVPQLSTVLKIASGSHHFAVILFCPKRKGGNYL